MRWSGAEVFWILVEAWLEVGAALEGIVLPMALGGVSGCRDGGGSASGSHEADWLFLVDVSRCLGMLQDRFCEVGDKEVATDRLSDKRSEIFRGIPKAQGLVRTDVDIITALQHVYLRLDGIEANSI